MLKPAGGRWLIAAMILAATTSRARGADFFDVTAVGGSGTTVNAGGGDVIDLANNLINKSSQFAALQGQGFTASLNYGGVANAVVFTENSAQTQATLTIPSTGFSKTFTGSNSSSLQTQIEDFLKSDGDSAYSALIQQVDQQSAVAAIDGNPQATTALIATDAFERFGIDATQTGEVQDPDHGYQFTVSGTGGTTRSEGFDGDFADLALGGQWELNDTVAIATATVLQYRSIGSSEVYTAGQELGLPITLVPREGTDSGWRWQITPWGFAGISGSYDQAEGALLIGGGATNSVSWRTGDLTFTLADQADYATNTDVQVDGYSFDVPVDQWIVKNGVDVSWQVFSSDWFVNGGGAYSEFLNHAAVPNYWTAIGGVGVNLGRHAVLKADFMGDFAPHYTAPGGEVLLTVSF